MTCRFSIRQLATPMPTMPRPRCWASTMVAVGPAPRRVTPDFMTTQASVDPGPSDSWVQSLIGAGRHQHRVAGGRGLDGGVDLGEIPGDVDHAGEGGARAERRPRPRATRTTNASYSATSASMSEALQRENFARLIISCASGMIPRGENSIYATTPRRIRGIDLPDSLQFIPEMLKKQPGVPKATPAIMKGFMPGTGLQRRGGDDALAGVLLDGAEPRPGGVRWRPRRTSASRPWPSLRAAAPARRRSPSSTSRRAE